MSVKCNTAEELGRAIKNKEDTIEIEGDLKNQVMRMKATGTAALESAATMLGSAAMLHLLLVYRLEELEH